MSSDEVEAESNSINSLEVVASLGDSTHEVENVAELLTEVELDLARSSEKLVNLDMLYIHVASRENDFETFASEEEQRAEGPAAKALEFDLLYGIFDSEVKELESFLFVLRNENACTQETLSSSCKLSDALKGTEERIQDCEDSLKLCFEQVLDMKVQSANFKRVLLLASSGYEKCKTEKEFAGLENCNLLDFNAKTEMQTAEQQRNILRMLEKSLAREMEFEKKLTESRQNEEDLQLRLHQLIFWMEVEAEDMWGRLFEAENKAGILLEISKEILGKNRMVQISINESTQREGDLRLKLQNLDEQLKEKASDLLVSETYRAELMEKVSSLEQRVREFEGKVSEVDKRAEIAEAECKLLRESNTELDKYTSLLKSSIADASEKLEQLERLLQDSEIKRLHAVETAVASDEKLRVLECTIEDMKKLIKYAESQTESAEEKCIILSESNAELIEETNFLRHRIQQLEKSLHRVDEAKKVTAKDIRVQTKLIADLVLQLAFERERLHKQISSLAKERKISFMYWQQMNDDAKAQETSLATNDNKNGNPRNGSDGGTITSYETGNLSRNEIKTRDPNSTSNLKTLQNIDAKELKYRYILMAIVVLGVPALVVYLLQL